MCPQWTSVSPRPPIRILRPIVEPREVAALAIVHPVLGSVDAGAAQDHGRQPALAVHLEQIALAAHLVGAVGVEAAGLVAGLDHREVLADRERLRPRVDGERADEDVAADVLAEEIDHRLEVGALVAGGVEDDVEVARAALEDAAHSGVVAAVGLEPLDAGGQVGLAPPAIEDRHLVTGRVQRAEQSESHEPGAAEEERSHVRRPFCPRNW